MKYYIFCLLALSTQLAHANIISPNINRSRKTLAEAPLATSGQKNTGLGITSNSSKRESSKDISLSTYGIYHGEKINLEAQASFNKYQQNFSDYTQEAKTYLINSSVGITKKITAGIGIQQSESESKENQEQLTNINYTGINLGLGAKLDNNFYLGAGTKLYKTTFTSQYYISESSSYKNGYTYLGVAKISEDQKSKFELVYNYSDNPDIKISATFIKSIFELSASIVSSQSDYNDYINTGLEILITETFYLTPRYKYYNFSNNQIIGLKAGLRLTSMDIDMGVDIYGAGSDLIKSNPKNTNYTFNIGYFF